MIVCVLFYYHKAQSGNATGQATPTGQCGSEKAVTKDLRQRLEDLDLGGEIDLHVT